MAKKSSEILEVLNAHLIKNHFVAGDDFTFGDIPLGVLIHKYFVLDIERPSLTGIEAWYKKSLDINPLNIFGKPKRK